MSDFDPSVYPNFIAEVIPADRLMPLDEGRPDEAMRPALEAIAIDRAFEHERLVDADMARCCLAGLWLLHDFLDESHALSQGIATPSGSFWHGIMHRREGDFSNAKYWFHRAGHHDVFGELSMPDGGAWNPDGFVDDCQRALRSGDAQRIAALREAQQREWQALFDYCYRAGERGT